jgi:hypothetical protein
MPRLRAKVWVQMPNPRDVLYRKMPRGGPGGGMGTLGFDWCIMSLLDEGQVLSICLFRSVSEPIRMPRKHWWNFDLHQWIFLFLTDLLGYMVIQIIYKQLLTHIYTDIKREISTNMTQGLYICPPENTEYTKYNYSLWHAQLNSQQGKQIYMKNLFRLTWKKSRSWVNIQETEYESHAFMVLNGRGNVGRTR